MPKPVELTAAEWAVIKAVWADEPATAPAVQQRLAAATGWTYSTVRTLLDRMAAKGLLTAEKDGKLTFFRAAVTRDEARHGELMYALRHAFDGALTPMIRQLIETRDLSEQELGEIEALLLRRRGGDAPSPRVPAAPRRDADRKPGRHAAGSTPPPRP